MPVCGVLSTNTRKLLLLLRSRKAVSMHTIAFGDCKMEMYILEHSF